MIAAHDAEDRVGQLTALTLRLTDLLAAEAAHYEARRPQDAAARSEEIARLANVYRHETLRIKADPSMIAAAAPAARQRLIRATEAFEAVLARHGRAIAAAKAVTEGLVQAIAEEVAATRSARSPYGADARTPSADATAITLNRRA
jgi:tRNA A37 N6-isopentenylltransferase MiaA